MARLISRFLKPKEIIGFYVLRKKFLGLDTHGQIHYSFTAVQEHELPAKMPVLNKLISTTRKILLEGGGFEALTDLAKIYLNHVHKENLTDAQLRWLTTEFLTGHDGWGKLPSGKPVANALIPNLWDDDSLAFDCQTGLIEMGHFIAQEGYPSIKRVVHINGNVI